MGKFKDLRVWREAIDLAEDIYRITSLPPFSRDFSLCDQMRRAAVSIASNIAEGDERRTNKEAIHFFSIAKGSTAEVITQLIIAHRIKYIDDDNLEKMENAAEKLRASLKNLIRARIGSIKKP